MFLFTFPWRRKQLGFKVYIVSRHFLQHTRRRHHSCWHLLQISFPPFWTSSNTAYMSACHTVTLPLLLTNTEPQCSKYAITLRGLVFATQPHCGQQRSSPGDNEFKIITTHRRSSSGQQPTEWTQFEGNRTWQKDFSCRYLKYFCIQNIWAPGSTQHRSVASLVSRTTEIACAGPGPDKARVTKPGPVLAHLCKFIYRVASKKFATSIACRLASLQLAGGARLWPGCGSNSSVLTQYTIQISKFKKSSSSGGWSPVLLNKLQLSKRLHTRVEVARWKPQEISTDAGVPRLYKTLLIQ